VQNRSQELNLFTIAKIPCTLPTLILTTTVYLKLRATAFGQNQPLTYQDLIDVLVGAAARGYQ
jgi:hypothetical protein